MDTLDTVQINFKPEQPNGRIERAARTASAPNQLLQVVTTRNDKGGDDRILTANGGKVLVGGFGADIIHARDGDALVMGDNAQIDYDAVSRNGVLRSVVSTDIVIGGNDTITLEEGLKLVSGGFGADTIQIEADNIGNVSGSAATSGYYGHRGSSGNAEFFFEHFHQIGNFQQGHAANGFYVIFFGQGSHDNDCSFRIGNLIFFLFANSFGNAAQFAHSALF